MISSHTSQPNQSASSDASIVFQAVRKPRPTMIWVTETVGDRARLVARWTTQD
ncbi:MAG: hypothetical protein KME27_20605 [Lyngbya sp. HA4199-MV5]|jgi:hypothetical protein|nr:hypothetical protein [Lyngbya sp. HA4199-MV5]